MLLQPTEKFLNIQSNRSGLLKKYISNFATRLTTQGYPRKSIEYKVRLVAYFGEWVSQQNLNLEALSQKIVEEFLLHRSCKWIIRTGDTGTLIRFIEYLQECGVYSSRSKQLQPAQELPIKQRFKRYLDRERGLVQSTVIRYLFSAQQFLSATFGEGLIRLEELCTANVTDFILLYAKDKTPHTVCVMVTALRSFFRFLRFEGVIEVDLAGAALTVPNRRLTEVPKSLEPDDVDTLLNCSKREGEIGLRDYAILLLLSRLGLRAGEVVSLTLDDLDWDSGQITVHGKGLRTMQLPIPQDVGNALASYLRHGRPICSDRHVFIRSRAPRVGFSTSMAICNVVRRALTRADLSPARKGAHLLRHSLAVRMLRSGASLAQIGDVLGHQSPSTTEIYAKVDFGSLHELAMPWPVGVS
ncbi:MAG: tyrosine-type recombinase/integrase [Candidatus Sabulitectum sp.]|nr:tyrosine-type recombinase/integrase [Candidatus Sabulitectum sp.]